MPDRTAGDGVIRLLSACVRLLACSAFSGLAPGAVAGYLTLRVEDADSGNPLAARIYLSDSEDRRWYFMESADGDGTAVRYDRTNWLRDDAFEKYTSVSGGTSRSAVSLPDGLYRVRVEKGREWRPEERIISMTGGGDISATVALHRWVDMSSRGFYSGETHVHRSIDELKTLQIVEDLNVTFPLTMWVTRSGLAPAAGNKNQQGVPPPTLVTIDPTHVIWPRNTEYEIFSVSGRSHTLGALFVLGHSSLLQETVPPWTDVGDRAFAEGALMDMDKLDWPFSMILPPVTGATLYELANNHMWRAPFAFTDWNTRAPAWLQPPSGGNQGSEWDWIQYTFGMYYTLLNAGLPLVPSAGTASGVHPVPIGFSRVYIPLENGFSYQSFFEGLRDGRGFVTTGPMLVCRADGHHPGAGFSSERGPVVLDIEGEAISAMPLSFIEVVENGIPVRTIMARNDRTDAGGYITRISLSHEVHQTGWVALRCYEDHQPGRVRFAHTGIWDVRIGGKPRTLRPEEKDFLVRRVEDEISRSREVIGEDALGEYHKALNFYRSLPVNQGNPLRISRRPVTSNEDKIRWLENALVHHGLSVRETALATGVPVTEIEVFLETGGAQELAGSEPGRLKLLPYPGGRHPRSGFFDGAIDPMRDTKFSVFLPWDPKSYVVVDLPEAIWSNLGLTWLAHTHIPTVWGDGYKSGPIEWQVDEVTGGLSSHRSLPDAGDPVLSYHVRAVPGENMVGMEITLTNHSDRTLTALRAQVCNHLKGALGFHQQTGSNKTSMAEWQACFSADGSRWIITGWESLDRTWQNPPVPCIHSDPSFPDCGPRETVRARGVLLFHEGRDIDSFLESLAGKAGVMASQLLEGNQ